MNKYLAISLGALMLAGSASLQAQGLGLGSGSGSGSGSGLSLGAGTDEAGALDRPLPVVPNSPSSRQPSASRLTLLAPQSVPASPQQALQELRKDVREEQNELEKLDRSRLATKAQNGERAAQIALGNDFAQEAALLAFAPAAANSALSDAVRWYSQAASRGYPGAPSLDLAGIRFFPIRIQRE